jgi:hypothetical protein
VRSFNITGAKVTTVDATANVTILTYNIPANTGICARVMVQARNTATNRTANFSGLFGAQNQAGVASALGIPRNELSIAAGSDPAMNTVAINDPVPVGGAIDIQVTGLAATTIQWQASLDILGGD